MMLCASQKITCYILKFCRSLSENNKVDLEKMANNIVTIAISTAFQDAGDATRAIEIAKGLKAFKPDNLNLRIIFISHGSKFENTVLTHGFQVHQAKPKLPGVGLYQDLGMTITNLIGTKKLAEEMLLGEIEAYKTIKPDFV